MNLHRRTVRARRWPYAILLVVCVLLGTSEWFLPRWASSRLEQSLRRSLGQPGWLQVQVRAFPAFRLLAGRIDRLHVEAREFPVGGLAVEACLLEGRGVVYDAPQLYRQGVFALNGLDSLRVSLVVNEKALNEYFWRQADPSHRFRLQLADSKASLSGSLEFLGRPLQLAVGGRLSIAGPTTLSFLPEELSLQQFQLPRFILDAFARRWTIHLDFSSLPFPLQLTDVTVQQGRLYVYGQKAADTSHVQQ